MGNIDYSNLENADLQCIVNPILAKRLFNLGLGKYCVDLKPNKKNSSGSVFLFVKDSRVMEELENFMNEMRENRIMRDWYTSNKIEQ